jgi:hypothetical protein
MENREGRKRQVGLYYKLIERGNGRSGLWLDVDSALIFPYNELILKHQVFLEPHERPVPQQWCEGRKR